MKSYSINLKEDSIFQLFIKIAIPSSIGTIFQNLYSVVDSIFAGKMISTFALAAIGQIFPIYFVIIALGVGDPMDITAAGVISITTSAGDANITIDPNGAGTLALGSADNTAVIGEALKVTLNGKGATADAIKLNSDGGIQAWVAEEKILELGNDDQYTYLRITPGVAGVEKIEV